MNALSEAEILEISGKVGHPRGNHARKPVDVEKARAMRLAGFSMEQIGAFFDVSSATILRRFRERPTLPASGTGRAPREGRVA